MTDRFNSAHAVTGAALLLISAGEAEWWTKILSAAVPAVVAAAYTIWKWRKDAKK